MSKRIDRRQALGAFGTISLGGLLAACGGDSSGGGSASVATTSGDTATVEPKTATSAATSAQFEDGGSCTLTVEETEGPYYFDADKIRSDIREDREGARLTLALRVLAATTCKPIPDAVVDIWHADAGGDYSGFDGGAGAGAGPGGGGPGGGGGSTTDTRYLRGAQVTNNDGVAEFTTIYPGWYQGRTTHIHAKVHLDNATVLTTQLFFEDDLSTTVYEGSAYSGRGQRDQFNDSDGIFDASLVVGAKADGDGYRGAMTFNVRSA